MNYKYFFFIFFLLSCDSNIGKQLKKSSYSSTGFAYIYNETDYLEKIINKRFNSNLPEVSHLTLKAGTIVKLTNPINNKSHKYKIKKKSQYPDFYKILITNPVANKLNLSKDLPFVEIVEVKKNKSFIAKKTKIFKEEEKIHTNAPVELVKIDNISKDKKTKNKIINNKYNIIIGEFYSMNSVTTLKKRIINELINFNDKNLYIKVKKTNKITLLSGPYKSINLLKNDYIQLKKFGFEELDININE